MKKIFLFCCIFLISPLCWGKDMHWVDADGNAVSDQKVAEFIETDMMAEAQKMAQEMQPVYENMKTCSPAESEYLKILGKEGDLCHFKYVDYDCRFPQDIAEEYSELGIKVVEELMKGNLNTQSPENIRIQEILSNKDYCSYEMSWTVVDEDGNEVSGVEFR